MKLRTERAANVAILAMACTVVFGVGGVLGADGALGSDGTSGADSPTVASEQAIHQLIERLGAPEYAQREKARDELQQLGVVAFEALHEAQRHADVEIRKQAEYLLRAIRISWIQEDDPEQVKLLLRRYERDDYSARLVCLEQLGRLKDGMAVEALCRLARFETSEVLSRYAALAVMRGGLRDASTGAEHLAREIHQVIGNSQRMGATWMRVFAQYLKDPESTLDDWRQLAEIELEAARQRPDKDRLAVLQDLLRWQIEMLQRMERDAEMLAVLQQLLPLQGDSREELLQTVEWLLERQAWSLIDDLVKAFPTPFEKDPFLLYRRAEAALLQGRVEDAKELAARALTVKADDEPSLHVAVGFDLQGRGRFDWAEREYRRSIETAEQGTHSPVVAAIRLGWMFHDLARNREAHDTFRRLVDLMKQDKNVVRRVQELNRAPMQIRGQMHFSRALELADQQKWEEHRQELEQALKYDQENADILIAMYRVPNADDQWHEKTARRIQRLRERYSQQVARAQRDARAVPGSATRQGLALALNQSAWLVSNTEGDNGAALRDSHRSLELVGKSAGYLDTLARCYFAVGDFAAASKFQRQAVELEPHTGQIRRQMELFEKTIEEEGPGTPYVATGR